MKIKMNRIYYLLFNLVPINFFNKLKKLYTYSNINVEPKKLTGFFVFFSIFFSITFVFLLFLFMHSKKIVLSFWILLPSILFLSIISIFSIYLVLLLISTKRGRFVDQILPDVLLLISTNLKSGMSPDRAIMLAARPEFGPLENEFKRVAKETIAGKELVYSLSKLPENIHSKTLRRAIDLIIEGLENGGELSSLLEQIANDIREIDILEKELQANVMMYVMFILIAVGFGAPLLFAISTHLVGTLTSVSSTISLPQEGVPTAGNIPININFNSLSVSPEFIKFYSVLAMIFASIFGSLIIGAIRTGKLRDGLKYMLPLIIVSLALFFLTKKGLATIIFVGN